MIYKTWRNNILYIEIFYILKYIESERKSTRNIPNNYFGQLFNNYARFQTEILRTNFTRISDKSLPAKFKLRAKNTLHPLLSIFSNIRRDARYPEARKQFTSTFRHDFIAGPIAVAKR